MGLSLLNPILTLLLGVVVVGAFLLSLSCSFTLAFSLLLDRTELIGYAYTKDKQASAMQTYSLNSSTRVGGSPITYSQSMRAYLQDKNLQCTPIKINILQPFLQNVED